MKVINGYHNIMKIDIDKIRKDILEFEDNYDGNLNNILSTEYFESVPNIGNFKTVKEILNAYINLYNRANDASVSPEKLMSDDIPF